MIRHSASAGYMQWCDDSSKSPGELNDPLSVVIRGLPFLCLFFMSCISLYLRRSLDMVLEDWHRRVPQHPVASTQSLNGQWPLPDPHWTISPSLLTNMLTFRSTPRTWLQNCTIWLNVSNNRVHWWPVLPAHYWRLRDFGKFMLDPTSLIWAVSFVVIMRLGPIMSYERALIHLYNGTIRLFMHLLY